MSKPVCRRCGKCCVININGQKLKRCPYLVGKIGSLTSCRIYHNRLGKDLGHNNKCRLRTECILNFPGCPFNTEDGVELKL